MTSATCQANVTFQQAVLSSDLNGDGIAGIGDTLTFSCRSDTASPSQYPFVNLSQFGNPYFALPNIAGNFYSAFFTISPGNVENNSTTNFQFVDEDGVRTGGSILIDNHRPYSQYGPSITGGTGPIGTFKVGDTMTIDMTMNSAFDDDIPRANLSVLGVGGNHMFTRTGGPDSAPIYQFVIGFPTGIESAGTNIQVYASDDAGNSKSWDVGLSYDTIIPEIQSVTAVNMTTGKSWVTSGDTIRLQAVVEKYDNDTVKVYNSALFPSGLSMVKVSGGTPGQPAVFQLDYYFADVPDIQSNFVTFDVKATDNAGNESNPRTSNPLALDNIPPEFALPFGIAIQENSGVIGDNIAIIGDKLHIFGNLATLSTDVTITTDLSSIGGVSNQIIPFNNSATTTFELYYNVHQFTSEDNMPRSFTVVAKDTAGNQISQVTLPIIYVDNDPPRISAGQVQNVTTPNSIVKYGNVMSIQANVTNVDGGSVWTNFERVGGTASSTLTPYSGSTYRLEQTVGDPSVGAAYDQNVAFPITVVDNAGNMATTLSNTINIDNEPPLITGSSYTSTPVISANHPYVAIGDQLTFKVSLASSTSSVHDGETVNVDLTDLGQTTPFALTYDGIATYTGTIEVPSGTLNNNHYFSYIAKDNAGNTDTGSINVLIDNKPPDVGPMTVNFMTDMAKSGVVNINDRLEFIVPAPNEDQGTCTIDLSMVGSSSASIMNYDPVLNRYYLVYDCKEAAMENVSYVFKAIVSDKAKNTMNSLSPTMEVDCRPPVLYYASATVQELEGNTGVVNVGDKVTIYAKTDLTRLDGGVPVVNLTALGGSPAQQLYDDGAHNDGIANDGIYGFTQTVASGTLNGENLSLVVELTDNAGNRVIANTESLFVDNKPLEIISCTNTQTFDNNGNSIVDLDGTFTTYPSVATDVLRLEVKIAGDPGDMGAITTDLTPLGINNTAVAVPYTTVSGGWQATADYSPMKGSTNSGTVALTVTLTDVNGNKVIKDCTNTVTVDNSPAGLETYPISFVVDKGRLNEANKGDVIQIRVKVTNNDGILPMIDLTNLYLANGMTPPSPILFPPNSGGNEYTYDWTIPEGLGTVGSLTILAYDSSGNMTYGYTNEIRFLSKVPVIEPFPKTRCDLISDNVPAAGPNRIANPGDKVLLTCTLSSVYNRDNTPPATVLADIRSIISSPADDSSSAYFDGNSKTYWTPLTYQPYPISGAGNYVYIGSYTVSEGNVDTTLASFAIRVLHPDVSSIVLATTTMNCDSSNPFGIDTEVPKVIGTSLSVVDENNDNIASNAININDLLKISTQISKLPDPGSATAVLLMPHTNTEIFRTPLYQLPATDIWEAQFRVATTTPTGWPALDGVTPDYKIIVSDDADNFSQSIPAPATFTIDNDPPQIVSSDITIDNQNPQNWVANIGDGYTGAQGDGVEDDGIIASLTVLNATDLTGNGMAYIDLSPIGGTSTYKLTNNSTLLTVFSDPFRLATQTIDLGTFTLRLHVRDNAGNTTYAEQDVAIDTTRPEVKNANYDGNLLKINFTEPIDADVLATHLNFIRIGSKMDLSDTQIPAAATQLIPGQDAILEHFSTDHVSIQMASYTKGVIADWGPTNLYLSIGHDTTSGEAPLGSSTYITIDDSGNWLRPLPRTLATQTVTIPVAYTDRPHLTGGHYDANTPSEKGFLYLDFDKDMDVNSISTTTLKNLAIWVDRGNPDDTYQNRYRFVSSVASDTIIGLDTPTRLKIGLSQSAQDWIAMNYTRIGSQLHFEINGSQYEPPNPMDPAPLIRDFNGNRVYPITYSNATPATLIPLNTPFSIQNTKLDLTGTQPILTIGLQNSPIRRARLYNDPYKNLASQIERSHDLPIDLSAIFLYAKADLSGGNFPLNNTMVDYTAFKTLNTDYASNVIHIPLTSDALKSMLSWGTSKFYIACSNGALKDLWGNANLRYPAQGGQAALINTTTPTTITPPSIQTLAVSPAKSMSSENIQLVKGQTVGNFFYEVAFNTATLSADVYIPIDRTKIPTLKLYTQNDPVNPKDTATFIAWEDHNQGGITRTVARFANNSDLAASKNIQREPCFVKVENFSDVFGDTTLSAEASLSYNLADKDTSTNGFKNASYTIVLDNQEPTPISVIPTGTMGITPQKGQSFYVTFDEPMDESLGTSWQPVLRLGDNSNTVMTFAFQNWISSTTARFVNNLPFDETTPQGTFTYYVSGGYDEAGNQNSTEITMPDQLRIRSKGPNIVSYKVTTYQSTTAKLTSPSGNVSGKPFSPYVYPGIATITITFQTAPTASALWLNIYQGGASLASVPITISGLTGTAQWDGTLNGVPIGETGPTTYELRVFDDANNEGSTRGSIVYDGKSPYVSLWSFKNVKTFNGKAYFSPAISSFAKIDAFGPSSGQALYMRLTQSGISTDSYPMSPLPGGGYTISFNGQNTDTPSGDLGNGEYLVSIVDQAGNLGQVSGTGQATATLVIDRTAPVIGTIQTYRVDNGSAVTRFNPNVTHLRIEVTSTDTSISSGTALIRIKAGSSIIKEIPLQNMTSPFIAYWDGTDKDSLPVTDGTYKIEVVDLAGNVSTQVTKDIDVVNSIFKVTDVSQIDPNHIRMTFSHDVNPTDATNINLYTMTPSSPIGIGAASPITVNGKSVDIPLNKILANGVLYTVTVAPGFKSIDDDPISAGDNSAQFTADTQGPTITGITYDGLSSQKQFNIVFDEVVDSATAQNVGNYSLTTGTDTVAIESVQLRADLKSVTLTAYDDITEQHNYTIIASGVKDLFGNASDGDIARKTFQGHDVTPPVLQITAFSNPANEYDISVAVSSNEDLSGAPSATITQSGGTAVSLVLNAGPNNRMFIGGVHLDMNYPGVATIKVTASDISKNVGTANMSFSTAYVNASVRAEVKSPDKRFSAIFNPGTLSKNTVVSIVPEKLIRIKPSGSTRASIIPTAFSNSTLKQMKLLRASVIESNSAEELLPVAQAYSISVPNKRVIKPIIMHLRANITKNEWLYFNDLANGWKPVNANYKDGNFTFSTMHTGTFAVLKDIKAPRANIVTKVDIDEPIRVARPTFVWNLKEFGSGINKNTAKVILNNESYNLMIDNAGKIAKFQPRHPLSGGKYDMSLQISDMAGNTTITPSVRFQLLPPVKIYQVIQYPNPARRRVALRITSNRPDIDWGELEVKIYDISGDKVADSSNLTLRPGTTGTKDTQDIIWNLRALGGRSVANGVYIAKITLRDPDNWNKKSKYIQKIAVLR